MTTHHVRKARIARFLGGGLIARLLATATDAHGPAQPRRRVADIERVAHEAAGGAHA